VAGEDGNGVEAVRLASELEPDVATMDLDMPVMGGVKAIAELCAGGCMPIIVVSGSTSSYDLAAALEAGAR
jgi:two-component system, chemotaxis family, protein-glutamate methylesterase/glutaminase